MIKKNWKWLAGGVTIVVLLVAGVIAWRVFSFIGNTFGDKTRVSSLGTPTVDVQATSTALAHYNQVAVTPAPTDQSLPVQAEVTTTVSAVATPAPTAPTALTYDPNMPLIQRIRNGQRVTMVYMGYSGPGHEGPYLTDTVLVLSFDPKTSTVTEFNVPRDLMVPFPIGPGGQNAWGKMNGVFSTIMEWKEPTQDRIDPKYRWTDDKSQLYSAANLTADTVEHILGIPIDGWFAMDFNGFRKLIDAMGGVNVCVERPFTDKEYPANDNDQVNASVITIHFDAGCQQMNGETAIRFSRSRKSQDPQEGGDFARSQRQMKVIEAVRQKVQSNNLFFKFLDYMSALDNNIHTSLTLDEARSLLGYVQSSDGKKLQQNVKFDPEVISSINDLVTDGQDPTLGYVLEPVAGRGNFKPIQQWVQSTFTHEDLRREQVRLQVINSSDKVGAADRLTNYLADQGFRLAAPDPGALMNTSVLYDYTNGTAVTNLARIQEMLPGLKIITSKAANKPYLNAPDLILYIGKDYKGVAVANSK